MVKCPYCAKAETRILDDVWDHTDTITFTVECDMCGGTFFAEFTEKRCTDVDLNVLRGEN
jgi:endogenous inhibitor of DNA gyrase (YacG/DUF329 family)